MPWLGSEAASTTRRSGIRTSGSSSWSKRIAGTRNVPTHSTSFAQPTHIAEPTIITQPVPKGSRAKELCAARVEGDSLCWMWAEYGVRPRHHVGLPLPSDCQHDGGRAREAQFANEAAMQPRRVATSGVSVGRRHRPSPRRGQRSIQHEQRLDQPAQGAVLCSP